MTLNPGQRYVTEKHMTVFIFLMLTLTVIYVKNKDLLYPKDPFMLFFQPVSESWPVHVLEVLYAAHLRPGR